jgi:hypothetical protein
MAAFYLQFFCLWESNQETKDNNIHGKRYQGLTKGLGSDII